ncbi:MAG: hypothetical protein ACR2HP_02210 [Ilumatobacteraceae bacterium]
MAQAKAAADGRDVMLHGAYTARKPSRPGVLDAIDIQLRPVSLGHGCRLFEGLPARHIELELVAHARGARCDASALRGPADMNAPLCGLSRGRVGHWMTEPSHPEPIRQLNTA